ncbi:MAG: DinB family protein [Bacteroidetes bacterium]|nr:DinB family protein [Bacteroidota bacterium]
MYHSIQEFIDDWTNEHQATIKVFSYLTDKSLKQEVTPNGRTLGSLAWHIILSLGEIGGKMGLIVVTPPEGTPVPQCAQDIVDAYEKAGNSIRIAVKEQWSDVLLLETIEMYGEKWTRGSSLCSLVKHLIHHRGQMTILMRQAGLKVPGVYGPSYEEWFELGLPPAE